MPDEMGSMEVGGNFIRGVRKKKRRGILERLGLKRPPEDEDEDINIPGMRYENTRFGSEIQKRSEASEGIGDVGEWHAEDEMMKELEKRSKKKLKRMEKEAGPPWNLPKSLFGGFYKDD